MKADKIPYTVLRNAIEELKNRGLATNEAKNIKDNGYLVAYEELPLAISHSQIPRLFKIALYPEQSTSVFFGVWTEKGQKIEL